MTSSSLEVKGEGSGSGRRYDGGRTREADWRRTTRAGPVATMGPMTDDTAVGLLSPGAPAPTRARSAAPVVRHGRSRAERTRHRIVLAAHVLTSAGWFGAALVVAVLLGIAGASGAAAANALYRAVHTAIWVTVPLGAAAVVTGVVLGLTTKWGIVRYRW